MNISNFNMNTSAGQDHSVAYVAMSLKLAVALRALRNAFAMSQAELAELADCSRPTINRIESVAKASPRTDTVERLLQVFRDRGVEIQMRDTEVVIRFTEAAIGSATRAAAMRLANG